MFQTYTTHNGFTIGDHVEKLEGKTYCRGRICAIYQHPGDEEAWCVILIDKSEASGHLQHIYPLKFFTKVTE